MDQSNLRFTQNFLKSPQLVTKLVALADIQAGDTVLEIGPGKGIITTELLRKVSGNGKVIAVEFDQQLVAELQKKFADSSNLEIHHQDFLSFDLKKLPDKYHVVSNIPFNITGKIFEHLFTTENEPETAHLILQKESLVEKNFSGKDAETLKSLLIKPLYDIQLKYHFSRSDFLPQPSVETVFFGFYKRDQPLVTAQSYVTYKNFLAFISRDRVGEGAWRKLLTKQEMQHVIQKSKLLVGKGLKSQTFESILRAFSESLAASPSITQKVAGALQKLHTEQNMRENINQAGGHHRTHSSSHR